MVIKKPFFTINKYTKERWKYNMGGNPAKQNKLVNSGNIIFISLYLMTFHV